jgi:chromosome segregation ATPase
MANKNKKITSLVGAADNDPTSDLEMIPTLIPEYDGVRGNLEVDHYTSDINNDDSDDTNWSEAELRKLLNVRKLKIDDLKFELEQINGRRQGLEDELTVREQVASSINSEIRGARRQLLDAASKLQSLQAEYEAVCRALENANERSLHKSKEADQATKESDSKSTHIAELENQIRNTRSELADLKQYIDGRKERWRHHESEIEVLNDQVSNIRVDLEALSSKLGLRDDQLADIRKKFARESDELVKQKGRARKLGDENRELKNVTTADALRELKAYQDQVARQTSELAARGRSIDALRKDNERVGWRKGPQSGPGENHRKAGETV